MPTPATAKIETPTVTTRVLVVDDDPSVPIMFQRLMETPPPASVEVMGARTMEAAYTVARSNHVDAILLDLYLTPATSGGPDAWPAERTMPEIQGLSRAGDCPVLAFSGMDPDALWVRSVKKFGAYNFFSKQRIFDPSEFVTPKFRIQLLEEINNAIFLFQYHKELARHGS